MIKTDNKIIGMWLKKHNVITLGGDPCWYCNVCGKGIHLYGIENLENYKDVCPNCGSYNKYTWEKT